MAALRKIGAKEALTALSRRIAEQPIGDPKNFAFLLSWLHYGRADPRAVSELVARDPAAQVDLEDADGLWFLLSKLKQMRERVALAIYNDRLRRKLVEHDHETFSRVMGEPNWFDHILEPLLPRDPATHVALDHALDVHNLLISLNELSEGGRKQDTREAVVRLADRAAARIALGQPDIGTLLHRMKELGADRAARVLGRRLADASTTSSATASRVWPVRRTRSTCGRTGGCPASHRRRRGPGETWPTGPDPGAGDLPKAPSHC